MDKINDNIIDNVVIFPGQVVLSTMSSKHAKTRKETIKC